MLKYLQYRATKDKKKKGWPNPWNLDYPHTTNKGSADHHALVVIEHVPIVDLKAGRLLSDDNHRNLVSSILQLGLEQAGTYEDVGSWSFSFVSFNYFRWYDQDESVQVHAHKAAADRIRGIIDKEKPDAVFVLGDVASEELLGPLSLWTRGLPRQIEGVRGSPLAVNTLDPLTLAYGTMHSKDEDSEDESDDMGVNKANLIGTVIRHCAHGFLGRHPQDLSYMKPKAILVDTPGRVDHFFEMLHKNRKKPKAVDVEGTALNVFVNRLLTIQFSVSEKEGWVLPIYMPGNKWTFDERYAIQERLFNYFNDPKGNNLFVAHGSKYDITTLSQFMGVRRWKWDIWDTMAGEQLLDENIGALRTWKYTDTSFGLSQVFASYGNPYYYTAEFSKDDRVSISERTLDEKDILDYTAMDSQCLIGIRKAQLDRAEHMEHEGGNYRDSFERMMIDQMSAMIRVCTIMEYRGTRMDLDYLQTLKKKDNPLVNVAIDTLEAEFKNHPEVMETNNRLVEQDADLIGPSIMGGDDWLFREKDKEHRKLLLLDVMELEPVAYSEKTLEPSFGKAFFKEYGDIKVVSDLNELTKLRKIRSTYVNPYIRYLTDQEHGAYDTRVRPNFGYVGVVTGRGNSSDPSLQNNPEHGPLAAIVKRAFITPPGTLGYAADFSAHEIRMWGVSAGDNVLLDSCNRAALTVLKYRLKPTKKGKEKLKTEGDLHIINYSTFTGVSLKKVSRDQRQHSKVIGFGNIYGKSVAGLAQEINRTVKETGKIVANFFRSFAKGKAWLDLQAKYSRTRHYVVSFLGRRRNLYGALTGINWLKAACERRGKNSPIQGGASDVCYRAADLFSQALYDCYVWYGVIEEGPHLYWYLPQEGEYKTEEYLPLGPNVMIHDSIKGEASFKYYFMHLHLLEWSMTLGIKDVLVNVYGLPVEDLVMAIELDVSASWESKKTWEWTREHMDEIVLSNLEEHKKIHGLKKLDPEKTLRKMKREYEKQREWLELDKYYPLVTGAGLFGE